MTRGNKLGTVSIVLVALSMLPPYADWKQPVNAALLIVAFALAYKAGGTGARGWYVLCGLLVAMLGGLLYLAWKGVG